MKEYLVFRLYGPMASWGQPAVGGERPTDVYPGRAALLGLLGAALGIKRKDEASLNRLQRSIVTAVKQCVPTSLVRDYHTAQVPSHNNKIVHRTRKSELSEAKLNTVLSSRDYRCDGLWVVAISLSEHSDITLTELKNALLKPVFTLSLGRKSCSIALPLSPQLIKADQLKHALDTNFPSLLDSSDQDDTWLCSNRHVTYYWEGDKRELDDQRVVTHYPWSRPVSRSRWQFEQSEVHQLTVEEVDHVSI